MLLETGESALPFYNSPRIFDPTKQAWDNAVTGGWNRAHFNVRGVLPLPKAW